MLWEAGLDALNAGRSEEKNGSQGHGNCSDHTFYDQAATLKLTSNKSRCLTASFARTSPGKASSWAGF